MSTEVVIDDVTVLEEADLDTAPPCGTIFVHPVTKHKFSCGKPSVIRVHMQCGSCARTRNLFLCSACYHDLRQRRLSCWYCVTHGVSNAPISTYREML